MSSGRLIIYNLYNPTPLRHQTSCQHQPSRLHSRMVSHDEELERHTFEVARTIFGRAPLPAARRTWVWEQHWPSPGGVIVSYSRVLCARYRVLSDIRSMVGLLKRPNYTRLILCPPTLLRDLRCAFCLAVACCRRWYVLDICVNSHGPLITGKLNGNPPFRQFQD